jgi:hypothetical protein|tara:strand:+ start:331 stop:615 length:285 start_codon:yes stop_codon:yes gene_type:complete
MRIADVKDLVGQDDGIKFTTSGMTFEGYVKEVNDTDILVRAYNICKEVTYETYILPYKTFKGINIEWFFEGQGCDNSAIGCSGYWVNDLQKVIV